jgi:glycine cleavage system H protein
MNIPENIKYTKDHEWIKIEGDTGTVGVTDYAQGELGDIVFIEVETLGEHLQQGDVFGTIEAVKTVSDLFLPVAGEIIEINSTLQNSPDLVNKDPFGKGWIVKLKIDDAEQLNTLLNAAQYKELINS